MPIAVFEVYNPRLKKNVRGIYEIHFTKKIKGQEDRSAVTSTRARSSTEAQTYLSEWMLAVNSHHDCPLTVADVIDIYKNSNTITRCYESVEKMVRKYLGHMPANALTDDVMTDYQETREISNASMQKDLGFISAIYNCAVQKRKIDRGVVPILKRPRPKGARKVYLVDKPDTGRGVPEFQALLAGTNNGRLSRIYRFGMIGLGTGARRNAIETLLWTQVDLGNLNINYQIDGAEETKKRRVVAPINARLLPVLRQAYAERTGEYVLDNPGDIFNLFAQTINNTPFQYMPTTGKNGPTHLIPHDLRRTFITNLVIKGVPLATVAQLVGDTVATIERNYLGFVPQSNLRDAAELA